MFSIDVEDWFHILELPSAPSLPEWDRMPARVERNFRQLLELAAEYKVRCTCFFLGWIARKFPSLVTEAAAAGHEIASHGWAHRLAADLGPAGFYADAVQSKQILEQITGTEVHGYRSAGFSLSPGNDWVFDELLRAGFRYDASLFPAARAHGGWPNASRLPHLVERSGGALVEFPMTTETIFGRRICLFGGGYLRIFPKAMVKSAAVAIASRGEPVIFYVHPREIDPMQPRLPMSQWRRFKTYVNLTTTEKKIRTILAEFDFATFTELAAELNPAESDGSHPQSGVA